MSSEKSTVVISGMSGRFPNSNCISDFAKGLYNKDKLTGPVKDRFPINGIFDELPDALGRVEDLDKFDSGFFGISNELANIIDPQVRKSLEVTVEAILDSGLKISDLNNSRTGLFFASVFSDIDRHLRVSDLVERQSKCSNQQNAFYRQIYQEWISYCLNLTGPTYHYESACSSSSYAFSDAFKNIQSGLLDTAIVVTSNLNLPPKIILQYYRLGIVSKSGLCKFADLNADGYVKSEAVCCLILQRYDPKMNNVKKIYSKIVNSKCNSDGFKVEGITFPKAESQANLIRETYSEVGLEPTQVNYVEAHGTGTQVGDIQEMNVIDEIFNDNVSYSKRKSKLFVGSVKSNIGHTESCSGLSSIIKCMFCFIYEKIPPIINYSEPNTKIPGLLNGNIQLVVDTIPLNTNYISLSSFGFGGSNTHVILENGKNLKKSLMPFDQNDIIFKNAKGIESYQLINLAARTEQGLIETFKKLNNFFKNYDINLREIYLLNEVFREQIKLGFNYTGHVIANSENLEKDFNFSLTKNNQNNNVIDYVQNKIKEKNSKLFLIIAGLGFQHEGMFTSLMQYEFFSKRVKQLCDLINPELDFDIYKSIISEKDESLNFNLYESIYSLLLIAIYQLSLIDFLKHIGIEPDGYLGHSFGEIICAYQDGLCTDYQLLLSTLAICELDKDFDQKLEGHMAVVSLSYEQTVNEIKKSKINFVDAACDNSNECVTVGGKKENVKEFLNYLNSKNIPNRIIASCGKAFHCHLIAQFYDHLLAKFEKIHGKEEKNCKRSNKWISTSINPFSKNEKVSWLDSNISNNNKTKISIARYLADCILKTVLFKDSCQKLLEDVQSDNNVEVFVMEIASKPFLTTLFKANTKKCSLINCLPTLQSNSKDKLSKSDNKNITNFLNILGVLSENNIHYSIEKLYSTDNSLPSFSNQLLINSLISWDHDQDFIIPSYPTFFNSELSKDKINFDEYNFENYLTESGDYKFSVSFLLNLVVDQLKENLSNDFNCLNLIDVIVYKLDDFCRESLNDLKIDLIEFSEQNSLGKVYKFIIQYKENEIIMKGFLGHSKENLNNQFVESIDNEKYLSNEDFYKKLENIGYSISTQQKITKENIRLSENLVFTNLNDNDWKNHLDILIQLFIYTNKTKFNLQNNDQVLQIQSAIIQLDKNNSNESMVYFDCYSKMGISKQIELKGLKLNNFENLNSSIDENNNFELENEVFMNFNEMKEKYVKVDEKKLSYLAKKDSQLEIGYLDKNNNFDKKLCWLLEKPFSLSYLKLLDGCLKANHILKMIEKNKYNLQSAFLSFENNLDLLIVLIDILSSQNCLTILNVKNSSKLELLKKCFIDTKNLVFVDDEKEDFDLKILRITKGEGVQLVIAESTSEKNFSKNLNCLGSNGKYINLNDKNLSKHNFPLGMSIFLKNIDFRGLSLNEIKIEDLVEEKSFQNNLNTILNSIGIKTLDEINSLCENKFKELFNTSIIQISS